MTVLFKTAAMLMLYPNSIKKNALTKNEVSAVIVFSRLLISLWIDPAGMMERIYVLCARSQLLIISPNIKMMKRVGSCIRRPAENRNIKAENTKKNLALILDRVSTQNNITDRTTLARTGAESSCLVIGKSKIRQYQKMMIRMLRIPSLIL
jgi:hypothetical protein